MKVIRANLGLILVVIVILIVGGVALFTRIQNIEPPPPTLTGTVLYRSNVNDVFSFIMWDLETNSPSTFNRYEADAANPAWSPDSRNIAYEVLRDGQYDIFVANAGTGNGRFAITDEDAWDTHPTWSADSQRFAFASDRDDGVDSLYVANSDGSGVEALTEGDSRDHSPAWSPDGSQIAFVSDRNGASDIFLLNVESGEVTPVTSGAGDNLFPAWSPDGGRLV